MPGNGADEIDGIENYPRLAVVHDRDAVNIAVVILRRQRGQHTDQFRGKWPQLLLPPWGQGARSVILLAQARREVAWAVIITLNGAVVLGAEIAPLRSLALFPSAVNLIFLPLAFALPFPRR